MKAILGTIAGIGIIYLAHLIPALLVSVTPEWLQASIAIFLFGVLPVWGFIKVAKWARP